MRLDVPALRPYDMGEGAGFVVGSGEVLADNSDATYIHVNDSVPPLAHGVDAQVRPGEPLSPHVPSNAVLYMRVRHSGPFQDPRLNLPGAGFTVRVDPAYPAPIVDGPLTLYRMNATETPKFIARWQGGYIFHWAISSGFNAGSPLLVYEGGIRFEWGGGLPPLRLDQRSDGLGMSSTRRHFPRTPSEQDSLRRAGGYF